MKRHFALFALAATALAASASNEISVNQVGFYPQQEKYAVVSDATVLDFAITNENGDVVLTGSPTYTTTTPWSMTPRSVIDFSQVTIPGQYTLTVGDNSAKFTISQSALTELTDAVLRSFYYQRTAMPIDQQYAGKWNRPAGHPDTQVIVHPSAASPARPAGTVISSSRGWYDAGDYNKYIVNSAFSIGIMLSAYRMIPAFFASHDINIPESGNGVPDILDEIYYNLEWMLTMQDPNDGGVYHKLTTPNFEGFVMPTDCLQPRYVVKKTVTAALDYAAVMAQAYRIYKHYNSAFPGFADRALASARHAFAWAEKNPNAHYHQGELNQQYDPDIFTGAYDDTNASDEFFWAATELYQATGDKSYRKVAIKNKPASYTPPTWGNTAGLGVLAWLAPDKGKGHEDTEITHDMFSMLINYCDKSLDGASRNAFHAPYGNNANDFGWGCLAENCAGQAFSLAAAFVMTNNVSYLVNAYRDINYILGTNPTGYCYVTGFGTKSPMHPHHRLSAADGIEDPIPGLLVGGPNPQRQDGVYYPSLDPDTSYVDDAASYASNEIAINWSATLVAALSILNLIGNL